MTLCGSVLLSSDGIPSPDGGLACMQYLCTNDGSNEKRTKIYMNKLQLVKNTQDACITHLNKDILKVCTIAITQPN